MRFEPIVPAAVAAGASGEADTEDLLLQLVRERERTRVLTEVGRAVAGVLNLDRVARVGIDPLVPALAAWAQVVAPVVGAHVVACSEGSVRRTTQLERPASTSSIVRRAATTEADLIGVVEGEDARAVAARSLPGEVLSIELRARGAGAGRLVVVRPEPFESDDVAVVEQVAQRLEAALDAARLYGELDARTRILQDSLLPRALPEIEELSIGAHFEAAAGEVGGDFYDVHGAPGDWSVTVGDVTGKGPHAAVRTGQARSALRTAALVDRAPAAMLDLANRALAAEPDGRFVTIACCRFRSVAGGACLETAVAGHPAPVLLRATGEVETIDARGTIAGAFAEQTYEQQTTHLDPGDVVVLYTDGLVEARRGGGPLLGLDRVHDLLGQCCGLGASAIVEHLAQGAHDHQGAQRADDVVIVAVRIERP